MLRFPYRSAPAAGIDLPIAAAFNPDDLIDLYALAQGRDIGRVSDDSHNIQSVGASLEVPYRGIGL